MNESVKSSVCDDVEFYDLCDSCICELMKWIGEG